MQIRLTRKLAHCLDGVDLTPYGVNDEFDLSRREARLLIAEGWAVPSGAAADQPHATVSDEGRRRIRDQLEHWDERQDRRRVEDRIRDELHDSRATTIGSVDKRVNKRSGTSNRTSAWGFYLGR
jgi:hypothetical protein